MYLTTKACLSLGRAFVEKNSEATTSPSARRYRLTIIAGLFLLPGLGLRTANWSLDISRVSPLTADCSQILGGLRATVNEDCSAFRTAPSPLTFKDAADYTGRRVIPVSFNGPDNASLIPPEDVAELAEGRLSSWFNSQEA